MKIKSGAEKKHLKLAVKLNLLGCDLKQTIIIYFGNHIIKKKGKIKNIIVIFDDLSLVVVLRNSE